MPAPARPNKLDAAVESERARRLAEANQVRVARQAKVERLRSLEYQLKTSATAKAARISVDMRGSSLRVYRGSSPMGVWTIEGDIFWYTPEGCEAAAFCAETEDRVLQDFVKLVLERSAAAVG